MADPLNSSGGIDPYVFWVLEPGRRYFFLPGRHKKEWLPLLLRLRPNVTARSFATGEHLREESREAWQRAIKVPDLFTRSEIGANEGPYITALMAADREQFEGFDLRQALEDSVESITLSLPLDAESLPDPDEPAKPEGEWEQEPEQGTEPTVPSGTVVMGIIDDGIAFAHERFRKFANGKIETRIAHWWLQDGPHNPNYFPFLPLWSQAVPSGCELNRRQINHLLQDCTKDGVLDEDLVYRKAKLINFKRPGHKSAAWRIAHGTHVMDLACGADPRYAPDDRPIICVQLPIRITADTSGGHLYKYVLEAIWYILDRASTLPGAAHSPVVVNLSYGRFEGPHDGTADIELAIDSIVRLIWKIRGVHLRVVLPAGNSYLSRTHAEIRFKQHDEVVILPWRVLPDDRTPTFAEIWLPSPPSGSPGSRLAVTVIAPTGERHSIDETGGTAQWGAAGSVYAEARYYVSLVTNRRMFRISLTATTDLDTTAPLAPAGLWKICLENCGLQDNEPVHAWVQRDDSLYGFPLRGRQSFFDDCKYVRFDHAGRDKETDDADSLVKREDTLNAMATGACPIVMGGFLRKERLAAKYSSAGAHVPPPRWPDAMTPSEDSRVHSGILAAGSHSGSVIAMGGTSVAAPQIARVLAEDLSAGGPGNHATVAGLAAPTTIPPERSGAGLVDTKPIVPLKRYD
jgi:hypothetical protein